MNPTRPFLSFSVRLDGVFDVICVLALSGSWLGLLGRWHWVLDLFGHFRWQYLFIAALAVGWSLWRRRRWVVSISIATLLLNVWLIGRLSLASCEPEAVSGPRLRLLSLNVLTSNLQHQAVMEHLRSANADVLFLMEIDSVWAAALESLKGTYPHQKIVPREDNFGLALLSRLPLEDLKVVEGFGDFAWAMPSIEARVSKDGREMVLIGTHPLPPVGRWQWQSRNRQLANIAQHVRSLGKPTLVVGDLNSTPWCEGMRSLRHLGALDFRSISPPWQPTWRVNSVLAIPIDHVLCSPPLIIVERVIGAEVGSDHRSQMIEVGWADER